MEEAKLEKFTTVPFITSICDRKTSFSWVSCVVPAPETTVLAMRLENMNFLDKETLRERMASYIPYVDFYRRLQHGEPVPLCADEIPDWSLKVNTNIHTNQALLFEVMFYNPGKDICVRIQKI